MYNQIKSKIDILLGNDHGLVLDDSEQSFVKYPTNHLNLIGDLFSINIGHVIYSNETLYDDIINSLKMLIMLCNNAVAEIGDYIQVIYLHENNSPFRVVFGGLDNDQQDFDFKSIDQLINKLKTFEFEA